MYCLDGHKEDTWCNCLRNIPENVSLVYHYRENFFENTDNITREDFTMWKYKNELIKAVGETLDATGFKP
jgi:hypothetical protein